MELFMHKHLKVAASSNGMQGNGNIQIEIELL